MSSFLIQFLLITVFALSFSIACAEERESGEPRSAMAALLDAARAGDAAGVAKRLYADDQNDRFALQLVADIAVARMKFESMVLNKFGENTTRTVYLLPALPASPVPGAKQTIEGDRAEIVIGQAPDEARIVLLKRDGVWCVPVSAIAPRPENAEVHEVGTRYGEMVTAIEETTEEVKRGLFVSADAATQTARVRLTDAATGKFVQ